jgi:menaquinone-specific isochorismate synthase
MEVFMWSVFGGLNMIDSKMKKLEKTLLDSISSIGPNESRKLFSITKKVDNKSPLYVFEGANRLNKDRFYWQNANRTLTMVGVGRLDTIEAIENRFQNTEKLWEKLKKEAWIVNNYTDIPGTGVVAFGGMDFDPLKKRTKLWKKFKPSLFYIPEMLLTEYESDCYLTISLFLSSEDAPDQVADVIRKMEYEFLKENPIDSKQTEIIKKEEIETEKWFEAVDKARKEMQENKAEKIVLARELRLTFKDSVNIGNVLEALKETQENSYLFAFERDGDCFIGATPERLVKVEQNKLLSTCLAGTAPRGKTEEEDKQIGQDLLNDKKNREEHDYVVQMIKEALVKTCTDVVIPDAPVLHPLKNLQHLYTPVTGVLQDHSSIFDVVKDLHPTPALGGTPTEYSLQFIRENEALDRGWYGAPIGWVDSNEKGEFAVAIRSALIQEDEASLFAGCGLLADSDPELEYEETKIKMLPMLNVLGGSEK